MNDEPIYDLDSLLVSMSPALDPREYVFVTVTRPLAAAAGPAMFIFRESEGTTYVLERDVAEELGLDYAFPCRRITLRVNSALDAVGFLAAVVKALATHGISTNAVSAYYHDHLFVPSDRADEAVRVLEHLSAESAQRVMRS